MTVPEENRRKTRTTDDVITHPQKIENENKEKADERAPDASGRTMREAMEEAGVKPEDYES